MFGRRKMYKKGIADAAAAYEAFGKKQEAALEKIREEVHSGNKKLEEALASLGEDIHDIYAYLSAKEKETLYHLSTPTDIKDFDDSEKRLLVAVLMQLASDEGEVLNESQKKFIRSVQRYLDIVNPQLAIDLSVVENIDSNKVQKAFLQVCLEFFYLQDSVEISESQEEFLDFFSVNKKQAELIEFNVSHLFNLVGPEGIVEKYGFVADEDEYPGDYQSNRRIEIEEYPQKEVYIIDETIGLKERVAMPRLGGFFDKYSLIVSNNYYAMVNTRGEFGGLAYGIGRKYYIIDLLRNEVIDITESDIFKCEDKVCVGKFYIIDDILIRNGLSYNLRNREKNSLQYLLDKKVDMKLFDSYIVLDRKIYFAIRNGNRNDDRKTFEITICECGLDWKNAKPVLKIKRNYEDNLPNPHVKRLDSDGKRMTVALSYWIKRGSEYDNTDGEISFIIREEVARSQNGSVSTVSVNKSLCRCEM